MPAIDNGSQRPRRSKPSATPSRKAIGYIRVSLAREEMISPEIQESAIRQWCRTNNRQLIDVIADLDRTGTNFARQGVQTAIAAVETGRAEEVVVWKFSRFGRNRLGWALNLARIEDAGGTLQSATEAADATTAVGKFTRGMLSELAAFEAERASEGWKEAQAMRLRGGLPVSGFPRFGYSYHRCGRSMKTAVRSECRPAGCKPEFRIDPITGPVLAALYRRFLAGEGISALSAWCQRTSQPRIRGGQWTTSSVTDILDSGFGAGLITVGSRRSKVEGERTSLDRHEWLQGAHEPVIEPDEWDAYLVRRAVNATVASSQKASPWPVTGLAKCGRCGSNLVCASSKRGRGYIYRCSRMQSNRSCPGVWLTRNALEAAVLARLNEHASKLEAAARSAATQLPEPPSHASSEVTAAKARLKQVRAELGRLVDGVEHGVFELSDIADSSARLRRERTDLLAVIDRPSPRGVTAVEVRGLTAQWDFLPTDTRREMLRLLVLDVTVHPAPKGQQKTIAVRLVGEQ
jgi:site-specific DNA recombinase